MEIKNTAHIYTVSNLTREIKTLLEERFSFVWVTGEISNFSTPSSGHSYFTLKDTAAVINAVMFKNQKRGLKFNPENGMKIFGLARISLYEPRGSYQLIFEHLEPDGAGSLQIAFEQLKIKLSDQGFFDEKHKKKIPVLSSKVCIITSATGAAVKDIINVAQRRFSNCCLEILPVKVQGPDAKEQICQAIEFANHERYPDLIILARGGGSLEDLSAFNSESVAISIYNSTIPVITGIGHETDFTIADFVADLRAPTPSAAAELAFPDKLALISIINKYASQIQTAVFLQLRQSKDSLDQLTRRLKTPVNKVYDYRLKLEDDQARLDNALLHCVRYKQDKLLRLTARLESLLSFNTIFNLRQQIYLLHKSLSYRFHNIIQNYKTVQLALQSKLDTLNPEAVLKRGYSISRTFKDKKIIFKSDDVGHNELIQVILHQGELTARVEK